ncbi:hypothetical protein PSEUDO8Z_140092 [Pseudomonas sp. 8Z]|nr:hypothetical protein PSEUDO8Z_140092 [Pseudomonas sp. 8Z]
MLVEHVLSLALHMAKVLKVLRGMDDFHRRRGIGCECLGAWRCAEIVPGRLFANAVGYSGVPRLGFHAHFASWLGAITVPPCYSRLLKMLAICDVVVVLLGASRCNHLRKPGQRI